MSISHSLVAALVDAVERAGVPAERFLARGGLDPALLEDPAGRMALPRYDALQELAVEMSGDAALGLHMGEHARLGAFHVVGHLVSHCRTIRDALAVFLRYHRLVSDCAPPQLIEHGADAQLVYGFPRSTPLCTRLRAEFGLTRLITIAHIFTGERPPLREVRFEHARPDYADEYRRIFGDVVRFDCEHTAIVAERGLLDARQRHADAALYALLDATAGQMLRRFEAHASIAQQAEDLLAARYPQLQPDMETVARRLGMSARSLRRRLREEGECFARVQQRALARASRRVLDDPSVTIQEAAFRLGFSEASSFHRAFKRWTGLTPREYRDG